MKLFRMKYFAIGAVLLLLAGIPALATVLPGVGRLTSSSTTELRIDLNTRQTAGVYQIGRAYPMANLDFTLGSAFSGVLYGCDLSNADADFDEDVDTSANCVSLVTLTADTSDSSLSTAKRFYILDVNTAESTDTSPSRLTIKGSFDQITGSSGGGSGLMGWPSFESLGGDGRPTQALVVDTLNLHQRGMGPGHDTDGSIFSSSCVANAADDFPCIGSLAVAASSTMSLDATATQFWNQLSPDIATDDQWQWMCRDSVTLVHAIGTANDTEITAFGDPLPLVLHDDSSDIYRVFNVDQGAGGFDCEARTGDLVARNEMAFDLTTSDTLQHFVTDAVHVGPYGGRWYSQRLLNTAFMDQYPAIMGTPDLISDGYFESACTALTFSSGTGAVQPVDNSDQDTQDPFLGGACRVTSPTDPWTATSASISAVPGEYYVGQVMLNLNAATANDRSLTLQIRDDSANNISNAKFWIDGQPTGGVVEAADVTDSTGTATPGEYNLRERMCYGGCTIKFAFQIEPGDTGFDIQFDITDTYQTTFDEFWVRKKLYQDLERHPIIADGRAEIQVFTDSRGNLPAYERFTRSLEYMAGFTTSNGDSRTTIRPDLHLTKAPTSNQVAASGRSLGDFVGLNDGNLDNDGTAISQTFSDLVSDTAGYCISLFGINGQLSGNLRPGFGASATPADTDKYRFFGDQIRGFEMMAEANGCIPIILMDHMGRVDTGVTDCHDEDGGAINCGTWHNDNWVQVLHSGIPSDPQ